jgi:hypothetical protein
VIEAQVVGVRTVTVIALHLANFAQAGRSISTVKMRLLAGILIAGIAVAFDMWIRNPKIAASDPKLESSIESIEHKTESLGTRFDASCSSLEQKLDLLGSELRERLVKLDQGQALFRKQQDF